MRDNAVHWPPRGFLFRGRRVHLSRISAPRSSLRTVQTNKRGTKHLDVGARDGDWGAADGKPQAPEPQRRCARPALLCRWLCPNRTSSRREQRMAGKKRRGGSKRRRALRERHQSQALQRSLHDHPTWGRMPAAPSRAGLCLMTVGSAEAAKKDLPRISYWYRNAALRISRI